MAWGLYRTEPGRVRLSERCGGEAVHMRKSIRMSFRGLDVSQHGIGCIIGGSVCPGDEVCIKIGTKSYTLRVMWCESHLGIDNMSRVGLFSVDGRIDLAREFREMGLLAGDSEAA